MLDKDGNGLLFNGPEEFLPRRFYYGDAGYDCFVLDDDMAFVLDVGETKLIDYPIFVVGLKYQIVPNSRNFKRGLVINFVKSCLEASIELEFINKGDKPLDFSEIGKCLFQLILTDQSYNIRRSIDFRTNHRLRGPFAVLEHDDDNSIFQFFVHDTSYVNVITKDVLVLEHLVPVSMGLHIKETCLDEEWFIQCMGVDKVGVVFCGIIDSGYRGEFKLIPHVYHPDGKIVLDKNVHFATMVLTGKCVLGNGEGSLLEVRRSRGFGSSA